VIVANFSGQDRPRTGQGPDAGPGATVTKASRAVSIFLALSKHIVHISTASVSVISLVRQELAQGSDTSNVHSSSA
jgi:hypothetical protein